MAYNDERWIQYLEELGLSVEDHDSALLLLGSATPTYRRTMLHRDKESIERIIRRALKAQGSTSGASRAYLDVSEASGSVSPATPNRTQVKIVRGALTELGFSDTDQAFVDNADVSCLWRSKFASSAVLETATSATLMKIGVSPAAADYIVAKARTCAQTRASADALTAGTTEADVEAMKRKVAAVSDGEMLYDDYPANLIQSEVIIFLACCQWMIRWTQALWRASRRRVWAWVWRLVWRELQGVILVGYVYQLLGTSFYGAGIFMALALLSDEPQTFEHFRREHFKDDAKELIAWHERLCAQSDLLEVMVVKVGQEAARGAMIGTRSGHIVHEELVDLKNATDRLRQRSSAQVAISRRVFGNYLYGGVVAHKLLPGHVAQAEESLQAIVGKTEWLGRL